MKNCCAGRTKAMKGIKNWISEHPNIWEFILFNVLSNVATVVNFAVMWICTGFVFSALNRTPFRFLIFNYTNVESDLGLCGFASFLMATACAQTVNFLFRRILYLGPTQRLPKQCQSTYAWLWCLSSCRRLCPHTARHCL